EGRHSRGHRSGDDARDGAPHRAAAARGPDRPRRLRSDHGRHGARSRRRPVRAAEEPARPREGGTPRPQERPGRVQLHVSGGHEHDVKTGPVMMYSAKQREVAKFYADLVGITGDGEGSVWMKTENADIVIHGRDERDAPPEVTQHDGFVVWFAVSDVNAAFQ